MPEPVINQELRELKTACRSLELILIFILLKLYGWRWTLFLLLAEHIYSSLAAACLNAKVAHTQGSSKPNNVYAWLDKQGHTYTRQVLQYVLSAI